MEFVEGIVRHYKRKYKRKLQSGKIRTYKTDQYVVSLSNKDHDLKDKQEIIVIPLYKYEKSIEKNKKELKEFKSSFNNELNLCRSSVYDLKSTIEDKNNIITELRQNITFLESNIKQNAKEIEKIGYYEKKGDEIQDKYNKLLNAHDILRNSKDHLQERYNKSQNEIIQCEKELSKYRVAITKLQSLSLMDRLLNKLPKEVKQLNSLK